MLLRHALPCARIAVLKRKILRVGTVGQNDRKLSIFHGAKDIGAEHQPIVHRDRHIPVDPHAVADFGSLLQRRHYALLMLVMPALVRVRARRFGGPKPAEARAASEGWVAGMHVFSSCDLARRGWHAQLRPAGDALS